MGGQVLMLCNACSKILQKKQPLHKTWILSIWRLRTYFKEKIVTLPVSKYTVNYSLRFWDWICVCNAHGVSGILLRKVGGGH